MGKNSNPVGKLKTVFPPAAIQRDEERWKNVKAFFTFVFAQLNCSVYILQARSTRDAEDCGIREW